MLTALSISASTLICALLLLLQGGRDLPNGGRADAPRTSTAPGASIVTSDNRQAGDIAVRLPIPRPELGASPPIPPAAPFGSAGPTADTTAGTGSPGPASESARPETPIRPPSYRKSLFFSGLFGLLISVTGIVMVSRRRRLW